MHLSPAMEVAIAHSSVFICDVQYSKVISFKDRLVLGMYAVSDFGSAKWCRE